MNFNLKDKNLDLISSNTGNTFDKTLNNVFYLYTSIKNDSVTVNFGDSIQQTIQLISSKIYINNIKFFQIN